MTMTPIELKATLDQLGVTDAIVREGENGHFYWVQVRRTHNGHRDTFSERLPIDCDASHVTLMADRVNDWWKHTLAND
jgi:hypothetical protein